ncbi:MAG: hypothetical protein WEB30_13025 [Cyclobacteriaceae bacterium]
MSEIAFGKEFSTEIESEVRATRRCLEAIPDKLYKYKPHEKSMELGYLALLVADIPRWILHMVERPEHLQFGYFYLYSNWGTGVLP